MLCAVGIFVGYTDNAYQNSKVLQAEATSYNDALTKAQELRELRDQLIARRNAFRTEDLQKLQDVLPDNVDNIRLVIDINGIAARHGLSLKNVQLGTLSDASKSRNPAAVGVSGDPVGSVTLGFGISASYDDFLVFLQDLEHSLRVLDIENLSFKADDKDKADYTFTLRTYWLH